MDNQIYTDLIVKTANVAIKNTVDTVFNRIDKAKANRDKDKTILELEELIKELIDEKNELHSVIKQYEGLLAVQRISNEDIEFITDNVIPILTELFESDAIKLTNEADVQNFSQVMEVIAPLLSTETLTILQLLGFNFKEAIGIPLSNVVSNAIDGSHPNRLLVQNNIEINKANKELYTLLQTESGREAYKSLLNKNQSN